MQALRASPSSSVAQRGTPFRAVPQLLKPYSVARSRVQLSSGASPYHAAPCARASKSCRAQAVSQQLGPADVESSPAAAPLVHAAERSRAVRTEKAGYSDCIMIQVFGWQSCTDKAGWYNVVKSKVADLQAAGFTHAWLPPPSNSPVSAQGYMPGQLYNLNSNYGNQQQLIELNRALREAGIAPIADIVINHRTASSQSPDGTWNRFGDDVDHEGRKIDWDQWAITSNDPLFKGTGNPDTGEDYGPAPDLDHANPLLREGLKNWLQWLHNKIGFDGWRLDFVKGYAAKYVTEYIESSVGLESVNVGEYWTDLQWNGGELEYNQDAARQKLCDWIDANGKSCAAFDFPTKGILQEAVKHVQYWRLKDGQGKAPGLIGWWPQRAVTFVDNHDTGSTQQHWPFPSKGVGVGYAYILTHPGIPCVFWEHMFDWGTEMRNSIEALIDARRRNGICADSKLEILCAEADMYVARIGGRLAVKLGPRYDMGAHLPKKEEGWTLAASGKDYAVWEKAA